MPILYGLLSRRIVGKVWICYIIIIIIIIIIIVVTAVVVGYTEMNFIRVMLLYCQAFHLQALLVWIHQ
jgi:MFS-type transporter involved in bile tolerance (Atg22 family)